MHVAIADCAWNRLQIVTICIYVPLSASISVLDHVTSMNPSVTHLVLSLNIAITGSDTRGAVSESVSFAENFRVNFGTLTFEAKCNQRQA